MEFSTDPLLKRTGLTRAERILRARIANGVLLAKTPDRAVLTAAARQKFLSRFTDQADPDGSLRRGIKDAREQGRDKELQRLEDELNRRIGYARSAHFSRLALRSSQARAARKKK